MLLFKARIFLYYCLLVWKLLIVNRMVRSFSTDSPISTTVFSNISDAFLSSAINGGTLIFDSEEGALKDLSLGNMKINFEKNSQKNGLIY